jgi:choline dehydrogenase
VTGRLIEGSSRTVLVLEAGPDYGPFADGRWPEPLLDARHLPLDEHDWRYVSAARHGQRDLKLERARVIGGCSSHNGCAAVWGHRSDYDAWGVPGWSAADLAPLFEQVREQMRIRLPEAAEIDPFHAAVLAAGPSAGLPRTDDLDDLDGGVGICLSPVNTVRDGPRVVRWNAAFGYLDPVRGDPHLTVVGDALVDRVVVEGGRAVAVEAIVGGRRQRFACREVVLAGGAYGSPAVLLRSGVGPADELRRLGVAVVHDLPAVGANLHDHAAAVLTYSGTPRLTAALAAFEGPLREEGTIAKGCSSRCGEAFDLHVYPFSSPSLSIPVACMTPRSRGSLRLASADPEASPIVDHGYLTDPDDRDLAVLRDGLELVRRLAAQPPLASLLGPEVPPDVDDLRAAAVHYYHPVGTCALGSVLDPEARVLGVEGLRVADASVMPQVPRANTNVPCLVVGEKVARCLLSS